MKKEVILGVGWWQVEELEAAGIGRKVDDKTFLFINGKKGLITYETPAVMGCGPSSRPTTGDPDKLVVGPCARCGVEIRWTTNVPKEVKKICLKCVEEVSGVHPEVLVVGKRVTKDEEDEGSLF